MTYKRWKKTVRKALVRLLKKCFFNRAVDYFFGVFILKDA